MSPIQTRFARIPAWAAGPLLLGLAVLMLCGISIRSQPINAESPAPYAANGKGGTDADLYRRIVSEVRAGGSYYPVTAQALREGNYPLRPFVAFRLPTLATLLSIMGATASRAVIFLLIAGVIALWTARLGAQFATPAARAIGGILVLCGAIASAQPAMIVFHETWAALLIALSLALRHRERWIGSVIAGLCAVMIRETAIAYIAAMAVLALLDGQRKEAKAWGTVIAIFAVYLAWHASQAASVTGPADPVSEGWSGMGGWSFFLSAMRLTTPLTLFPQWVSAILIPLALLGWTGWRAPFALRTTLTLMGYVAMIMVFARPDNFYWGLLIAPLLLLGLMFVPASIADLTAAFRRPALDSSDSARQ